MLSICYISKVAIWTSLAPSGLIYNMQTTLFTHLIAEVKILVAIAGNDVPELQDLRDISGHSKRYPNSPIGSRSIYNGDTALRRAPHGTTLLHETFQTTGEGFKQDTNELGCSQTTAVCMSVKQGSTSSIHCFMAVEIGRCMLLFSCHVLHQKKNNAHILETPGKVLFSGFFFLI